MLEISIGKQELKANNIVGIYGDSGTGKSCLMAQIAYRLSMNLFQRCLLVDGVIMTSLTEETREKYTKAVTAIADEYPAILIIDSLELLIESDQKFYETVKERVNTSKWNLIYTTQELRRDFNLDNNILLHTTKNAGTYNAEIILPAGIGIENVTDSSF